MADSLAKYGIYIDDLCKIRVLEPEVANQTNKLKEECQNFVSSEFHGNCSDHTILRTRSFTVSARLSSSAKCLCELPHSTYLLIVLLFYEFDNCSAHPYRKQTRAHTCYSNYCHLHRLPPLE